MQFDKFQLKFFADYIETELGIVYSEDSYYQLEMRLRNIAKQLGFDDSSSFYKVAQKGIFGDFKMLLLDAATNNETSFFRDEKVFQAFREEVLPTLATQAQPRPIRIWSAACSRGQEVYSLLMLMHEFEQKNPSFAYRLEASDVSEEMLRVAQAAVYSQLEIQRGLPAPMLIKFFRKGVDTPTGGTPNWEFRREFIKNVHFFKHNLISSWSALPKYDVIFCRNVLIYQTLELKSQVLANVFEHLNPGGYLVLGGAESLIGITNAFEMVRHQRSVFYRRPAANLNKIAS